MPYAQKWCQASIEKYGRLSLSHAAALNVTGKDLFNLKQPSEGISMMKEAAEICDSLPYAEPEIKSNIIASYKQYANSYIPETYVSSGLLKDSQLNDSSAPLFEADANALLKAKRYSDAYQIYKRIADYYLDNLSSNHIDSYLRNICEATTCLISLGKLAKAEEIIFDAYNNTKNNQVHCNSVKALLYNMGLIYYYLQNYDEGLMFFKAAKGDFEKTNDIHSMSYGLLLAQMSLCYLQKEDYLNAKLYLDEARDLLESGTDIGKDLLLTALNNDGILYSKIGHFEEAIIFYSQLAESAHKSGCTEQYYMILGNLGDAYLGLGDYEEGRKLLSESVCNLKGNDIRRDLWQEYIYSLYLSHSPSADDELEKYNEAERENLAYIIGNFSEKDWENYWVNASQTLVSLNNMFLNNATDKKILNAFDNAVYVKKMLLSSSDIFSLLARDSKDSIVTTAYKNIRLLYAKISDRNTPSCEINHLREVLSSEQKIIARHVNLSHFLKSISPDFKEVASSLEENEVAVEFIQVPKFVNLNSCQMYYGALAFRKGDAVPTYVELCQDSIFKEAIGSTSNYSNELYRLGNTKVYELLWKPLEHVLHKGNMVYYSVTGDLGRVNYDAIPSPFGRLGDIYDLRLVSSTANIPQNKKLDFDIKTASAVVYGGINYSETINSMETESQKYRAISGEESLFSTRGSSGNKQWSYLPATKEEAEMVSKKLSTTIKNIILLEGNEASEESFKNLDGNSPDILHVATHGYSYNDLNEVKNKSNLLTNSLTNMGLSLQLSGLLFAGANNSWNGSVPTHAEDGILTTEEISRLNLSNTKLVILSACKTGLGVTGYVDGVFGLQRGFKRAGAGCIVISLWAVNDAATDKLMQQFYDNLLSGEESHKAFKDAVCSLRKVNPDPYYWAGFVMLD